MKNFGENFSDKNAAELPVALTIAGSDSGGGAGIQADLLTFAAHGVFGTTAITALTAQNPAGVSGVRAVAADFVREQAEQVARFFKVRAAKTGMLADAEIIAAVADFFDAHREIFLVVDPVMVATSGAKLLAPDAVSALRERLIPRAALVTPNLDEAEVLLGEKFAWRENSETLPADVSAAAKKLARALGVPVLLKGGHGNGRVLHDALAFPHGDAATICRTSERIQKVDTHGSGCTLSAAIAANLAKASARGASSVFDALPQCVADAEDYVRRAMSAPVGVGGSRFIAHLRGVCA